jgi:hypothetical protein
VAQYIAAVTGSRELRGQDGTLLVIELLHFDSEGQLSNWSGLSTSVALAPLDYYPASGEWVATTVDVRDAQIGVQTQYSLIVPLTNGSIPGVTTLVAGRQYGVWVRVVGTEIDDRLHAGVIVA